MTLASAFFKLRCWVVVSPVSSLTIFDLSVNYLSPLIKFFQNPGFRDLPNPKQRKL